MWNENVIFLPFGQYNSETIRAILDQIWLIAQEGILK